MPDRHALGLRLRQRHEFGDGLRRHRRVRRQHERDFRQHRDRREILDRVERHRLVEADIDRQRAGRAQSDRVAVGRRLGDEVEPDIAARTRPVVDDEGLAELVAQPHRHRAGHQVGAAAGRKADDEADLLGRIGVLCRRRQRQSEARSRRQRPSRDRIRHVVSPFDSLPSRQRAAVIRRTLPQIVSGGEVGSGLERDCREREFSSGAVHKQTPILDQTGPQGWSLRSPPSPCGRGLLTPPGR